MQNCSVRCIVLCTALAAAMSTQATSRPRARDLGIAPGALTPGALNAITDVDGVRVGQVTITTGDSVRTGVTAIVPHGGNLFQEAVIDVISDNLRERRIARERIPAEKSSHRLGDGNVFGVRLRERLFQGGVVFRPEEREWRGERAG